MANNGSQSAKGYDDTRRLTLLEVATSEGDEQAGVVLPPGPRRSACNRALWTSQATPPRPFACVDGSGNASRSVLP